MIKKSKVDWLDKLWECKSFKYFLVGIPYKVLLLKLYIFQTQVRIGAVQRPLMADVHACHARPPVLLASPPGCTDPNVQCHPEHALAVWDF